MRLFGNVLGAFVIMEILNHVTKVLIPTIAGLYFDFFDGILQALCVCLPDRNVYQGGHGNRRTLSRISSPFTQTK